MGKRECPDCLGTGWQEMAEYDDGSECIEICIHCNGYGRREVSPPPIKIGSVKPFTQPARFNLLIGDLVRAVSPRGKKVSRGN